ncbi:MAG: hypothetical protein ACREJX_07380 [Polyangiaceae bacterium]
MILDGTLATQPKTFGSLTSIPNRFNVRIGDWGFYLSFMSGKLEIYRASRPDLAHLIVAWGTASEELDIHLTFDHEQAGANRDAKKWESILRLPKSVVETHAEALGASSEELFASHFSRIYRRYRPGWLARNDYWVLAADADTLLDWIRRTAPKSRAKYRIDFDRLKNGFDLTDELARRIVDPYVLHEDLLREPGLTVQVMQLKKGRVRQERGLLLSYALGPDGRPGWWGMRVDEFRTAYTRFLSEVVERLRPFLTTEVEAKFELIAAGIGLNETQSGRELAENLRRCLFRGVSLTAIASSRQREASLARDKRPSSPSIA